MPVRKSDIAIQKDVEKELEWDARLDSSDVGVSVHDGVVSLTGSVNSWGKRLAAQDATQRVPGVLDVVNDLEVKLIGCALPNDTDVAKAVRHALRINVLVPHEAIHSIVSSGTVTLRGEVATLSEREDAARAVSHVSGVREVINQISVKSDHRALDIEAAVTAALGRHAERAGHRIEVSVKDGIVRMAGRVQSWAEKQLVLGAAKSIAGVRDIDDQVSIGAG